MLKKMNFVEQSEGETIELVSEETMDEFNEVMPIVNQAEPVEKKNTIYERLARWMVVASVFLVPLFFLPWTTGILELNKQMFLTVVIGLGIVFWFLHVVISGQISFRKTPMNYGILAFLAATVLATFFSLTPFKSLFGLTTSLSSSLITLVNLSLLYFLAINLFDDSKRLKLFFSISICLSLLYGLLQMLGVHILNFNFLGLGFTASRSFTTAGSLNALGILSAISLPLFARQKSERVWIKGLNIVGITVSLGILIILNWWLLWAVAIAGMVALVTFGSIISGRGHAFKISKFLLPMTVIVIGFFLIIVNFNLSFVKSQLPVEISPTFSLSGKVIKSVLSESPIFGYGPENFSLAFDKFGAKQLANSSLSNIKLFDSTSEVMNFVVHGGVVLLLGFVFLVWMIVKLIKKNLISEKETDGLIYETMSDGTMAMMVALIVGMAVYSFNTTLMFALFMVVALLVLESNQRRTLFNIEDGVVTSLAASLGFVGSLILILAESYFGATLYMADVKYAYGLSAKDSQQATDLIVQSINLNERDDRYYRSASQTVINLLVGELNKKSDKNDTQKGARIQNYITSAINLAKRATEITPQETNNWANLGSIYRSLVSFVDGVDELAVAAYQKSADLRPGDANIFNEMGNVYLNKADAAIRLAATGGANASQYKQAAGIALVKAEENFKKATDISSNFGLAIYNLGIVYEIQGKLNEAIKQLEKLIPFNNNQPNLVFELGLLYYRNGQKDKALAQLQRAVLLSSNFSNARWYLALIFEERKDVTAAIEQLEKILSLPENQNNQTVITKLNNLKNGKVEIPPKKVIDQQPLQ